MNLKLTDKTALVSGSTKGIGFAIATGLAREGARVIVNGRSEKSVAEAKGQIEQAVPNAMIESFAGDLSTAAATETLVQRFPFVDILVNNLGIFEPKPFEQISDEDWRRFFEVNVLSGVRLSRAYLSGMKQRNWGAHCFHQQRERDQYPRRNAALRHDEDCATCDFARPCPIVRRHSGHGERGVARSNPFRRRGGICRTAKRRQTVCRIRKGILQDHSPVFTPEAVRNGRRGGESGDLCVQPALRRD